MSQLQLLYRLHGRTFVQEVPPLRRKDRAGGGEMVQQVKEPVTKPDDLTLIPAAHTLEGKSQLLQVVL